MTYALQFLAGLGLLAIFGPPYLALIGIAASRDYLVKRRVRQGLR